MKEKCGLLVDFFTFTTEIPGAYYLDELKIDEGGARKKQRNQSHKKGSITRKKNISLTLKRRNAKCRIQST
jgi:hypothetical protein